MAKRGRKPAQKTEEGIYHVTKALTTQEEIYQYGVMCESFEKFNEDQRIRFFEFFVHKYREYLPLNENK